MYHVYIENSPDIARRNVNRFAAEAGLDPASTALLTLCINDAWLDGHAELALDWLSSETGISTARLMAAFGELNSRALVDCTESGPGTIVVRPMVLASQEGIVAGIGWWQRFALDESEG